MIIKCKMCGGDIQFNPGDTCGQCEYCGSTSTIPRGDDEQKLNRFNRANHFRRQGEFDKAIAAYERILEEDNSDAEAHWGVVLSRYGIEYVEDPAIKKRIPTCHRVQVDSIMADDDYQAALEYAPDTLSRNLYEEQAKEIAEIQKGILAISANEKPYDVFICYKESDENGKRTRDSALAQEVYYGLTEQGYKVFFSRITLEDKLGQEYEPYIFAALNSAKVMVVIGTKPEYFNAVWVKNEWSRYLHLMKNDRHRLLIPCYRDMDPYDLPEELSNLQSQDMSKIGFMQDLVRGVKKVLDEDKLNGEAEQRTPQQLTVDSVAPGVSSLLKRAKLFMEDGDFKNAEEYLDRILDLDPECSAAYAAKVCVEFGKRTEEELAELTFQFEDNANWKKAVRFADAQQKRKYDGYTSQVNERVNQQIRDYAYDCAVEMAVVPGVDRNALDADLTFYKEACTHSTGRRVNENRRSESKIKEDLFRQAVKNNEPGEVKEQQLKTAADMFDAIGDEGSLECAKQCRILAEQARQKAVYRSAEEIRQENPNRPSTLDEAAKVFLTVPEYKDARNQAQKCQDKAESIRDRRYKNVVSAMNEAGSSSSKWNNVRKQLEDRELNGYRDVAQLLDQVAKQSEECAAAEKEKRRQEDELMRRTAEAAAAKKKRNIFIWIMVIIAMTIAAFFVITKVIIPRNSYRNAVALQEERKYEEAMTAFATLGDYSDAKTRYMECENAKNYDAAIALQEAGKYEEAIEIYNVLVGYRDSKTRVKECQSAKEYKAALVLQENERFDEAITSFSALGDYNDSMERVEECLKAKNYKTALALQKEGNYEEAVIVFTELDDYSDAKLKAKECQNILDYNAAISLQEAEKYEEAINAFTALGNYRDVKTRITECQNAIDYNTAIALQKECKYEEAVTAFDALGDYKDSGTRYIECVNARDYNMALSLQDEGKFDEAITKFTALGDYSDSSTQVNETKYLQAKSLAAKEEYAKAVAIFHEISGYKDVESLLVNDKNLAEAVAAEKIRDEEFSVGKQITFGTYPQERGGNDKTPIKWLVLNRNGQKVLLISKYILDRQPYESVNEYPTWESCSLRTWLNETFLNKAFTLREQEGILLTEVDNSSSQGYNSTSVLGKYWKSDNQRNTQDKVFLLSYQEAKQYYNVEIDDYYGETINVKARASATDYASWLDDSYTPPSIIERFRTEEDEPATYWWLRSVGEYSSRACYVSFSGVVSSNVVAYKEGVRPVMWIDLESGVFKSYISTGIWE